MFMSDLLPTSPLPGGEFLFYQTEDGQTRIQCRLADDTIWLTQALIAELFQVTVPTVNEHLKGIFAEGELEIGATIRKFRMVRLEGRREVILPAPEIIAQEITDDLEAALEQFATIADDLQR